MKGKLIKLWPPECFVSSSGETVSVILLFGLEAHLKCLPTRTWHWKVCLAGWTVTNKWKYRAITKQLSCHKTMRYIEISDKVHCFHAYHQIWFQHLYGRRQDQRRKATMICHGRKVGSSFYTQEMGGGDSTGEGGRNIHGCCTRSRLRQFHKQRSS